MIIDEHKAIFIHIPKNAGNSIVKCFSWPEVSYFHPQHDTVYDIKKKFPELYQKWKKFAVVRNPYDRMVSWYFFHKENPEHLLEKERVNNISFNEWIKKNKFSHRGHKWLYKPQHTWVDDTVNILKFENLNNDINSFLNTKLELPRLTKTNREHYLLYYDKDSLNIVYNKYKEDFKKYNYERLEL